MRIEEGKYYRTRDGRKVGPAKLHSEVFGYWDMGEGFNACHDADGTYLPGRTGPNDLVSEWTDEGPVRTETVITRRIEPGVYGRLSVWVGDINPNNVYAALTNENGNCGSGQLLSASEWRELARVALELAEYLDAE